jgi:acetolactate synthase-1/3 small subunit
MHIKQELTERHVLTLTVDNEAGTLARIAGMFTSRGYNIDSLTVADISEDHTTSRITIVTKGPPPVIDQIIAAGNDRVVTLSRWLPKEGRWSMFTKDTPPVAWKPWPKHPEDEDNG